MFPVHLNWCPLCSLVQNKMQTDPEDTKAQGDAQSENGEKKSETEEMEVGLQQTTSHNCPKFENNLGSFEN